MQSSNENTTEEVIKKNNFILTIPPDSFSNFLNKNIASCIAQFLHISDFISISFCNKICYTLFLKNNTSKNGLYYSNINSQILPYPRYFKPWSWLIKYFEKRYEDNLSFEFLFNAKENNFSAKAFHDCCDKKQRILVLVKSDFGKYFGGFADAAFESPPDGFEFEKIGEKGAFLFSLSNRSIHKWKTYKISGIISDKHTGPKFNGGFSIGGDDCNTTETANSSYFYLIIYLALFFGEYYELPCKKMRVFSEEAKAWLSGSESGEFKVEDYEVWQVHFREKMKM